LKDLPDEFLLLSCACSRKDCFKNLDEACLDESLIEMLVGVYVKESVNGLSTPLFQLQMRNVNNEIFQDLSNEGIFFK
jgi:hypothetical protein